MTRVLRSNWLRYKDFANARLGRPDDPPELVDRCWRYLTEEHTGQFRAVTRPLSSSAAHRVQADLLAERVRRAATGYPPARSDTERQLAAATATIDRLLAFVPPRAAEIPPERLSEIAKSVIRTARVEFVHAKSVLLLLDGETDTDTEASCRMSVTVEVPPQHANPEELARAVRATHASLTNTSSRAEYAAIRLIVEAVVGDS